MSKGVCIHLKNFYHVPQCHDVDGHSLIVTLAICSQTPIFKAMCSFLNNSLCCFGRLVFFSIFPG